MSYGYRKWKLEDLKMQEGFYYVGDVCDVDGNPWLEADEAQKLLDHVNHENLEKVVEEDAVRRSLTSKHRVAQYLGIGPYSKNKYKK